MSNSNKVEYIITLKDQNFSSGIDSANGKVNAFEASLGKIGGLIAGAFAVNAAAGFAKEITTIGAQFDAYEVSLATLLKDSGKAHEVFQQIKKDAANTPFDTESLVLANRALIGAGESAEKSREVVLDLSNAIAATGGTSENLKSMAVNLNQIKTIGKASAMDIKQFVFAGIPIYNMLAEATGKSVDEVKEMDVSYEVLAQSLHKAAIEGGMFAGGLEKMSQSTAGQISNLEEAITFLKVDLYNSLKPAIQSTLTTMAEFVQEFVDMIKWADEHKEGLMKVFAPLKKIIDPITDSIMNIVDALREGQTQGSMLEGIFNTIGSVLEFMDPLFASVGETISSLIDVVWQLGVDLKNALDNKYVAAFVYGFRESVMNMVKAVKDLLVPTGNLIGGIITFDWEKIKSGLAGIGSAILDNNPVSQGIRIAKGIKEGYQKGFSTSDFFEDDKKGMAGLASISGKTPSSSSAALAGGATGSAPGSLVSSVKPMNFNLNIENLVREMIIKTENFGMEKNKIATEVSKILVAAVTDTQRLAGI